MNEQTYTTTKHITTLLLRSRVKTNVFPRNRCKIFMVRTSNPLIESTSSAEGTSAGGTSAEGTSAETRHKESTETHVN